VIFLRICIGFKGSGNFFGTTSTTLLVFTQSGRLGMFDFRWTIEFCIVEMVKSVVGLYSLSSDSLDSWIGSLKSVVGSLGI